MNTEDNSKPPAKDENKNPKCDWDFDTDYSIYRSHNISVMGIKILFERAQKEKDERAALRLKELSEIILMDACSSLSEIDLKTARTANVPKVYGPEVCY